MSPQSFWQDYTPIFVTATATAAVSMCNTFGYSVSKIVLGHDVQQAQLPKESNRQWLIRRNTTVEPARCHD
eukprot:2983199-Amphidinium_carterae.2